ncbi:gas vesicle protein GvpJ [Halostagnicola sp. A56]|uniref:gas vesicle protein GvpJ n=1 Tax=Halostagnicola sp. A56 TaxID=1495067 RepID=UPI0009E43978|nr:gas vesicle protein [Halostagnicola sp. A56]
MVDDFQPSRQQTDLAEVVELLLDKGIVINADIAVSIGDTQLLGIQLRAAIASFETAAKYGLEFPEGTDMRRVAEAVDDPELADTDRPNPAIDPTRGVNVTPNPEDGGGDSDDQADAERDETATDSDSDRGAAVEETEANPTSDGTEADPTVGDAESQQAADDTEAALADTDTESADPAGDDADEDDGEIEAIPEAGAE